MGNRCNDCAKFVSLSSPEVVNERVTFVDDYDVEVEVTINRLCDECGAEMVEATLTMDFNVSQAYDEGHHTEHHLKAEFSEGPTTTEEMKYGKKYVGYEGVVRVWCDCDHWEHEEVVSHSILASEMEEVS